MKNFQRESLASRLKGERCHECFVRGHVCQAQMFEGKVAMCLKCADGEPCLREKVGGATLLKPAAPTLDPCCVPEPTAEDLRWVRALERKECALPNALEEQLRGELALVGAGSLSQRGYRVFPRVVKLRILELLKTQKVRTVAEHFGFTERQIWNLIQAEKVKRESYARSAKSSGTKMVTGETKLAS